MAGLLTRRLLRDWKHLSRHYLHIKDKSTILFHLKPQDSNLHVWHLVIREPLSGVELYLRVFIGNEEEPTLVMRCLTPNRKFPINRNISLTHLNYLLTDHGFVALLQRMWRLFFESPGAAVTSGEHESRVSFAWNRIICRDFKLHFPELLGTLVPGDYEMVKMYSKRIKQVLQRDAEESDETLLTGVDGETRDDNYNKNNLIACDDNFAHDTVLFSKRRWSDDDSGDDFALVPGAKRARR